MEETTMTIRQLKKKLEKIPPVGAINLARRKEIIALIYKMRDAGK